MCYNGIVLKSLSAAILPFGPVLPHSYLLSKVGQLESISLFFDTDWIKQIKLPKMTQISWGSQLKN